MMGTKNSEAWERTTANSWLKNLHYFCDLSVSVPHRYMCFTLGDTVLES